MVGVICCGHVMIFKWIYIGDFCCGRAGKSKVLLEILADLKVMENIARVRNCPEVTILNSLFGSCFFVFFVFLSRHHSNQISEGSQVSKVTLCVKIQKWY